MAVTAAPINAISGRRYAKFWELTGKNKYKIVIATPAPELIPIILGSAKSFLVIVWRIAPESAKEAPVKMSIITLGNLIEKIIKFSLNEPFPRKTGTNLLKLTEE